MGSISEIYGDSKNEIGLDVHQVYEHIVHYLEVQHTTASARMT